MTYSSSNVGVEFLYIHNRASSTVGNRERDIYSSLTCSVCSPGSYSVSSGACTGRDSCGEMLLDRGAGLVCTGKAQRNALSARMSSHLPT